jgi:pimeloyl-ACP methyl ester carboxylesterase
MTATALHVDDDPAALVAALDSRARRFETRCGDGTMVWRSWGSGPPLLLLHGSHGSWLHWIRNIDVLAAHRTLWVADLPGYGESAMPPRIDHATIIGILADGIRSLLQDELPADVVGFSYGGLLGAYLAAWEPALVRRLVLIDTGGIDTPMGHLSLQRFRKLEGEERRAALRHNLLALMIHQPAKVDALALHLQEIDSLRGRMNPTELVLPDRLLQVLPEIAAPLGVIWGEFDQPHPAPAVQEEVLRRYRPELEFRVIADAGHWVMYEQPEAFNRTVLELLKPTAGGQGATRYR